MRSFFRRYARSLTKGHRFWKRKPKKEPQVWLAENHPPRNQQLNIKVSEVCKRAYLAIAKAEGRSNADLFEDMVVSRIKALEQEEISLRIG
jgi:hypothetical protein